MQLTIIKARSILESNIMSTIFQRKGGEGKKMFKKGKKRAKYLKNWAKMYKI